MDPLKGRHFHYKNKRGEWKSAKIVDHKHGLIQIRRCYVDNRDFHRYAKAAWVLMTPQIQLALDSWPWFPGMKKHA
jgi:hypothetical protein